MIIQLIRRRKKREEAEEKMKEAEEIGDTEAVEKYNKRTAKVNEQVRLPFYSQSL